MMSPIKSCTLDPVPTFLVRELIDLLLPYIANMVNASLADGFLPDSQKHAIVSPLLKKPGLDVADMANYRPVSNLTFVSKVTERVVASQLNEYLVANDLLPRYQSAYRKRHSTKTAMMRVWSDVLMAADRRQVTLLGLLDLSAAFDCVDHDILLQRLQFGLGLSDVVLGWIQSFMTNRTQQVTFKGQLSSKQSVLFGVLQGSVLGPLLYLLYTAELEQLILRRGLHIHQYADDSQVYISVPVSDVQVAVHSFVVCVHHLNEWMRASRLRLNPTKTQVMWLGSGHQLKHVNISDIDQCPGRRERARP